MDVLSTFVRLTALLLFTGGIWLMTDPRSPSEKISYYFTSQKVSLFISYTFLLAAQYGFLQKNILTFPAGEGVTNWGILLFITGFSFAIWAKLVMKRVWGPPGQHEIKRQVNLVTSGPFRYSRNPIYLGLLLGMFGYFIAIQSFLFIMILFPFFYLQFIAIPKEERLLEHYFGNEYRTYTKRVRRWM